MKTEAAQSELEYLRGRVAALEAEGYLSPSGSSAAGRGTPGEFVPVALLESSPDAFVTFDSELRLSFLNGTAERLFARERPELIGVHLVELLPPGSVDQFLHVCQTVLTTGSAACFELHFGAGDRFYHGDAHRMSNGGLAARLAETTDKSSEKQDARSLVVFDQVFEFPYLGICLLDDDGIHIKVNQAYARLFGCSAADLIGTRHRDLLPSEWSRVADERHAARIAGGEPPPIEWPILTSTGGQRWVWTAASRIVDLGGPGLHLCLSLDITARKEAEQRLRLTSEQLRLAQEAANAGVWDWHIPSQTVTWSPRDFRQDNAVAGADKPSFSAWLDMVHPEDRQRAAADILEAVEKGIAYDSQFRIERDGEVRWMHALGNIVERDEGRAVRMAGLVLDVTDRRRRAATLEESERRLDLAVRAHHIGIFDWDIATGRVIWTEQEERIFGITPGTFEGDIAGWSRRVHPDDLREAQELFATCWRGQCQDVSLHFRIVWPDGTLRHIESSGRFLYASDGRPVRMVGINIDVTERKRNEQILAAQAQELARSNEELQRFAYTASHDLQEPIRTIVSFTQLLAREHTGKLSKDANEYMTLILDASNRMSKLVASLLRYSRVTDDPGPARASVDMNELLADVLRVMSFSVADSGAQITFDRLPSVIGDEQQLNQLLQNLIANAIKYRRPEAPPRIHISSELREGREWLFSVSDNGLGFQQQYSENIFGIFKRLHGTKYSGTGIGLAICRKIVERHNGSIWATSEQGTGSTFFFTLPADLPAEQR